MSHHTSRSGFGAVLVVWVLMCGVSAVTGERVWKCSGKPTTYTYTDCETDRNVRDGCYYLVHFEQYRPCNDICDGIEMWSIDEERCRSLCSGYLSSFCNITSDLDKVVTKQVATTTTLKPMPDSTVAERRVTTSVLNSSLLPIEAVIVVASLAVILTLCIAIVISVFYCKSVTNRSSKNGVYFPAQVTDEEAYLESLKCGLHSDELPKQAVMDNNNNKKAELFLVEENTPLAMMVD